MRRHIANERRFATANLLTAAALIQRFCKAKCCINCMPACSWCHSIGVAFMKNGRSRYFELGSGYGGSGGSSSSGWHQPSSWHQPKAISRLGEAAISCSDGNAVQPLKDGQCRLDGNGVMVQWRQWWPQPTGNMGISIQQTTVATAHEVASHVKVSWMPTDNSLHCCHCHLHC